VPRLGYVATFITARSHHQGFIGKILAHRVVLTE